MLDLNSIILTRAKDCAKKQTTIQYMNSFKFVSEEAKIRNNISVSCALRAEQISPGGFVSCMNQKFDSVIDENLYPRNEQLFSLFKRYTKSDFILNIIKNALILAGKNGKILLEKSNNAMTSIELIHGYQFEMTQLWNFDEIKIIKPRIICIDGYIESISEITNLLDECAVSKEALVLITHGASDDVINTLSVNHIRKTLNVFAYSVPKNLDSINLLKDVAVVCGCDIVSKFKGQLLNSLSLLDTTQIDEIILYKKNAIIRHALTNNFVRIHINSLQERAKIEIEDVQQMLYKRIHALISSCVVVKLQDDDNFIINSQAIDYAIRTLKVIHLGIYDNTLTSTNVITSFLTKKCSEQLNSSFIQVL